MSLFSVVQNRIPPPPQPQLETTAGPPLPPMAPPIPGFDHGGQHNVWGGGSLGSIARKRASAATSSYEPYIPRNHPGDIISIKAAYAAQGYDLTDEQADNVIDAERANIDSERAWESSQRGGGSAAGPDHFYEQLAFEAAEAEKARLHEAAQAEKDRRDARQMANVSQEAMRQQSIQDYRNSLVAADAERKNLVSDSLTGAQDFYAKMISQADPNQGAQWVVPQQAYETTMNTKGPTWDAPVLPGTVFPENWG